VEYKSVELFVEFRFVRAGKVLIGLNIKLLAKLIVQSLVSRLGMNFQKSYKKILDCLQRKI